MNVSESESKLECIWANGQLNELKWISMSYFIDRSAKMCIIRVELIRWVKMRTENERIVPSQFLHIWTLTIHIYFFFIDLPFISYSVTNDMPWLWNDLYLFVSKAIKWHNILPRDHSQALNISIPFCSCNSYRELVYISCIV